MSSNSPAEQPQQPAPSSDHDAAPGPLDTGPPADNIRTPNTSSPPSALMPGLRPLPEYELVCLLGKGSYGEVWKAIGPGGIAVALKFITLGDAGDVELRSLEVMRDIHNPHLLPLFGCWRRDPYLILALELGDRTLWQRLQEALNQGLPGIPVD